MKRILAVDDEKQITRVLRTSLQSSGYAVSTAENGIKALEEFTMNKPDLIITDLAMPLMNGLELTKEIRKLAPTPIIVLSVRNTDTMKVAALDEGADDYLTKPFSMPELLARVRAQLRRPQVEPTLPAERREVGDFVLDTAAHTVALRGQMLHLTPKEFDLLALLLANADRVLTHKVLLRSIWGETAEDQPEYLRVLVGQLRKKLDRGDGIRYVHSEPWIGYRLFATGSPMRINLTDSLLFSYGLFMPSRSSIGAEERHEVHHPDRSDPSALLLVFPLGAHGQQPETPTDNSRDEEVRALRQELRRLSTRLDQLEAATACRLRVCSAFGSRARSSGHSR